jgi:hypothetical protein
MTEATDHVSNWETRIPPTTPEQRDRARQYIASRARDADDQALLLDALGLGDDQSCRPRA